MEKLLVSACLLGECCRYDGKNNPCIDPEIFRKNGILPVPVCPERDGGLPIPRPPAELRGGKLLLADGSDKTAAFQKGARIALKTAKAEGCRYALLKERSPSCGKGKIYDGSFSKTLTAGNGITAALLMKNGISVFGESELPFLLELIKGKNYPS